MSVPAASRTKWIIGIAGITLLVCGGLGYGAYSALGPTFDPGYAAGDYDAAKKEYLALGLPWEAKDLEPNPPIAPEQDATSVMVDLAKRFEEGALMRDVRGVFPTDADATAVLRPYNEDLDLASEILKRPRMYVRREWDRGPNVLFPEFVKWKGLARGLAFRARLRAETGDRAGALRDLRTGYAIGPLLAREPGLIAALVAIASDAIADDAARRVAARRPEWALAVVDAIPGRGTYDPRPAFRGEAFLGVATGRNLDLYGGIAKVSKLGSAGEEGIPDIDPEKLRRTGDPPGRILKSQVSRLLRYYSAVEREFERPGVSLTEAGKKLDITFTTSSKGRMKLSNLLAEIMLPVYSQALAAYDRDVTDRRLARLYCELVANRNRPATGWTPKVKDGWGRDFVYVRTADGFRLYSLGIDGVDDGGLLPSERTSGTPKSDDVAALYPPPVTPFATGSRTTKKP